MNRDLESSPRDTPLGLAVLFVRDALREPGCPLCALAQKNERRFLKQLLHENVNDPVTRQRIGKSLGFCRDHGRLLLELEEAHWQNPLGSSILYEDLTSQVLQRIEKCLAGKDKPKREGTSRIRRYWHPVETDIDRLSRSLQPSLECRVCQSNREALSYNGRVPLRMLSLPEDQVLYRNGGGICLIHLRDLLREDEEGSGVAFILSDLRERIQVLDHDLREYIRKQNWQCRHEEVTARERQAAARAVAFFSGSSGKTWGYETEL